MTKKEFARAMRCGLGRCELALQRESDIECFREIVLRGCLRNPAFDTQCEGTRSAYLYRLTRYFYDDAYFANPVMEAFLKRRSSASWQFDHELELLACFARGGYHPARQALYYKYDQLHKSLQDKRYDAAGQNFVRGDFEQLCIAIVDLEGRRAFFRIAEEIGALFQSNSEYSGWDFEWYYDHGFHSLHLKNVIEARAAQSAPLAYFYARVREREQRSAARPAEEELLTAEELAVLADSGKKISATARIRFARRAGQEEWTKLAQLALDERAVAAKVALLRVLSTGGRIFPLVPGALMEYLNADDELLREAAYPVLEKSIGEEVHTFAETLLLKRENVASAICMLARNFRLSDTAILLRALKSLTVTYADTSGWHAAILGLCEVLRESPRVKLPFEVLYYAYESSLCSCCRENLVREMGKRRMLTAEMLEECRFDSRRGISTYVARCRPST